MHEFPVLIHRWFPDGEGWAMHPALERDIAHWSRVLKPYMDQGRRGIVRCNVDSVLILAWIDDDRDCPDPKARARNPYIVRAVVLPSRGEPPPEEILQKSLAELPLPAAPRPDESLRITIPPRVAIEFSMQPQHGISWADSLMMAGGLGLIAAFLSGSIDHLILLGASGMFLLTSCGLEIGHWLSPHQSLNGGRIEKLVEDLESGRGSEPLQKPQAKIDCRGSYKVVVGNSSLKVEGLAVQPARPAARAEPSRDAPRTCIHVYERVPHLPNRQPSGWRLVHEQILPAGNLSAS